MGDFKKVTKLTGKFDNIVIHEGMFTNNETGEVVPIIDILTKIYGEDRPLKIAISFQEDEDIEI